jgi:acetyl esterase/lipase
MPRIPTRRLVLYLAATVLALAVVFVLRRPAAVLNWLAPGGGYQLEAGIAYGDLARQKLDVYRPAAPRSTPAPVVVFFYGGGWAGGDRGRFRFVGQYLARRGFVAVLPDYRLRPEGVFPVFLEDGAKALRWVQDHAAAQGGDPRRILLIGHSAGAYNAVMLALDRRYGAAAGFEAARLQGVVGLAGPYDFKLDQDYLRQTFGAAPDRSRILPVAFAAPGAPPMLLVTGDADDTVDAENSRSLARHLQAAGSPVRLRVVPGLGHNEAVLLLSWLGYPDRGLRDEIIRFLDRPAP